MSKIHVGFEVGTGNSVTLQPSHVIVTGLTQKSGKTTTLEAMINRSGLKAIVFRTKPGERGFSQGSLIPPYFREKSDWQYVASLLESTLREKLKFERSWIMTACKGTSSLLEVKRNIEAQLANPKLRDLHRSVYTTLDEYLNLILPQLSVISFSNNLAASMGEGVNIMDLERLSDPVQSLVIRSVLETVLKEMHDTIVVIPEAWKFLPQERGNPCKQAAEDFIRQGATNKNFLWIDSQDIAGVDKTPLKSVATWILGLQLERNEVKHTIDQMPIPKKLKPKEDEIMTLKKGHFFVCTPEASVLAYVQPIWLQEESAVSVAKGLTDVEEVRPPLAASLPPIPRIQAPEAKDERMILLDSLNDQFKKMRREFFDELSAMRSYVAEVASLVNTVSAQNIAPQQEITVRGPSAEEVDDLVKRALAKIPAQTSTGQSYTVMPLVALKKQFLQEAKDRIIQAITGLPEGEKKALKFIESGGKGVEHKTLVELCFGLKNTGDYSTRVKKVRLALKDAGLLRIDDKARSFPFLKDRIKTELGYHAATEQEIEEVYNHIIHSLL